jgi:EAL domain-containing protein (putative c-di-GMP-specific phosphodiesterase class I)
VIRQAFQVLRDNNQQDQPTGLSINLSTQSLTHGDMSRYIADCLVEFNVDPRAVIFEVTESGALNHLEAVRHLIQVLKPFGCRFALDDFGIGFSSFAHLKHLDVDFLKIDGSFIQGLLNEPVDLAVISAITNIAHSIGKIAIAEHVDHPEILRALHACGVDQAQGFYIGRPRPSLRAANGQLELVHDVEPSDAVAQR